MSRNIDDLRRQFKPIARQLIADTHKRGFEVVPYFTLRTPSAQARLWRMTRGKHEIGHKVQWLLDEGALYIANVIDAVGRVFPSPGITGHVTYAVPGESWHNWGDAIDCYLKIYGEIVWDGGHEGYAAYGEVVEELGCTWGGRWRKPNDPGHAQQAPMSPLHFYDSMADLSGALDRKYGGQFDA